MKLFSNFITALTVLPQSMRGVENCFFLRCSLQYMICQ